MTNFNLERKILWVASKTGCYTGYGDDPEDAIKDSKRRRNSRIKLLKDNSEKWRQYLDFRVNKAKELCKNKIAVNSSKIRVQYKDEIDSLKSELKEKEREIDRLNRYLQGANHAAMTANHAVADAQNMVNKIASKYEAEMWVMHAMLALGCSNPLEAVKSANQKTGNEMTDQHVMSANAVEQKLAYWRNQLNSDMKE